MTRLPAFTALFATLATLAVPGRADLEDAIVKIYTVHDQPDYYNPWRSRGPMSSTGSGCIISENRILSNGHVVSDQTYIQVRRNGEAKRYAARVIAVSHDADLAILTVDDEAFFEGVDPLEFGELPNPQDEVNAYGFPLGGDSLSITKGVISRIEHQTYAHSSAYLLAGQMDAAINPGNSGGPILKEGKIVGVAMQGLTQADNIGYMVPVPVIEHFFKDIEDGEYDGFPALGIALQGMESEDLKKSYNMSEDMTGVLVTRVVPGSAAEGHLQVGDVLLSVDGQEIADNATSEFRPNQRTHISYFIQEHQIGELLAADIWRDGKRLSVEIPLVNAMGDNLLIPMEAYDEDPSYYIIGGVVIVPLTKNFLRAWGNNWYQQAPNHLVALLGNNFPEEDGEQIVMVMKVLAAEVNEGYHDTSYWIIKKINGEEIKNVSELIERIESSEDEFIRMENETGGQLVLDREKALASRDDILATYRIISDRSEDLK